MTRKKNAQVATAACLDEGKSVIALLSGDLKILKQVHREIELSQGPETVVAIICQQMKELLQDLNSGTEVAGAAIAFPGIVDPKSGSITESFGYGWDNVALKRLVEDGTSIRTAVEATGNAMLLGETVSLEEPVDNLIGLFIDETVQGGIVVDGKPYRGARGGAGQFGHVLVSADSDYVCRCGQYGHLESYISSTSMIRQVKAAISEGGGSTILDLAQQKIDEISTLTIYEAALSGDQLATRIMEDTATYIAQVISPVVGMIDAKLVILGGSVIEETRKLLLNLVRTKLDEVRAGIHSHLGVPYTEIAVVKARLGRKACLIGLASVLFSGAYPRSFST